MSKVTSFDRATCQMVQKSIQETLNELGEELGLSIVIGSGRFDSESVNAKLEITCLNPDGSVKDQEAENFKLLAKRYGLKASDLDKEVMIGRQKVIIKGLRPSCRKYPVMGEDARTGKGFKYRIEDIKRALGYESEPEFPVFGG